MFIEELKRQVLYYVKFAKIDILLGTLFVFVYDYFLDIKQLVILAILLVVVDMITGIQRAKRAGILVESAKMKRTVIKFLTYICVIVLAKQVDKAFELPFDFATLPALGAITMTELKSIDENLSDVFGVSPFALIVSKIKTLIK
jgi:hypothetical protein